MAGNYFVAAGVLGVLCVLCAAGAWIARANILLRDVFIGSVAGFGLLLAFTIVALIALLKE